MSLENAAAVEIFGHVNLERVIFHVVFADLDDVLSSYFFISFGDNPDLNR